MDKIIELVYVKFAIRFVYKTRKNRRWKLLKCF